MEKKLNKALTMIIIILIITVLILGSCLFLKMNSSPKSQTNNSRVESSSKSHSKRDKGYSVSSSTQNSNDNSDFEEGTSNVTESQSSTNSTESVIVQNGPDFSYRAAQKLGVIDSTMPLKEFYANCDDDENGFIYNGRRYNTQVIKDGHENDYHCNILVTPEN